MYQINQDLERNLVTIEIVKQIDSPMIKQLLEDLNKGRKQFKAGYSALLILGPDLDFVDTMFAAMDLTAYKAKMARVHKGCVQYPKGNERSKVTAEKLLELYERSDIKTKITESQYETNRWLGL